MNAIYFLGAGGIGMSALVRYYLQNNYYVAGYDRTPTPLTHELEAEGAHLTYDDAPESIPEPCRDATHTLVVYTPAVPQDATLMQYFRQGGFQIKKRAEVLGLLTQSLRGLCVAGTHGKTTTSSMVAHLLHESHVGANAFLGGITKNYGTNYLVNAQSPYVVIEADEFDRSFHHLRPWISIITSADADHLDIYGTEAAYLESFAHYTSLIQEGGALIQHVGLRFTPRTNPLVHTFAYGRGEGDFHAEHERIGNGRIVFDFCSPLGNIPDVELGVPVSINIENGIAAMAMAQIAGAQAEEIREAMKTFAGVDRRFDFRYNTPQQVLLSDYAHHPEEIRQSILSLREVFDGRRIAAIFQPHLYTRTRDFHCEFADALNLLDEVVLLDIYPAREAPLPGVTSQIIFDHLRPDMEKHLVEKAQLLPFLNGRAYDVLVVLGAGDVESMMGDIENVIRH